MKQYSLHHNRRLIAFVVLCFGAEMMIIIIIIIIIITMITIIITNLVHKWPMTAIIPQMQQCSLHDNRRLIAFLVLCFGAQMADDSHHTPNEAIPPAPQQLLHLRNSYLVLCFGAQMTSDSLEWLWTCSSQTMSADCHLATKLLCQTM